MYTHRIEKHQSPVWTQPIRPPYIQHQNNHLPTVIDRPQDVLSRRDGLHSLDKISYARWIESTVKDKFPIGSFWVDKSTPFPYEAKNYWKVKGIQELHYHCEGNKVGEKCRPIYCANSLGDYRWFAPLDLMSLTLRDFEF